MEPKSHEENLGPTKPTAIILSDPGQSRNSIRWSNITRVAEPSRKNYIAPLHNRESESMRQAVTSTMAMNLEGFA